MNRTTHVSIFVLALATACGGTKADPQTPEPGAEPTAAKAVEAPKPEPVELQPGKFVRFELMSTSPEEAGAFYAKLFKWEIAAAGDGWAATNHGRVVATIRRHVDSDPAPTGWLSWIEVEDLDDTVRDLTTNGGTVKRQRTLPEGRLALIEGPTGGVFGVLEPSKSSDPDRRVRAGDFALSQLWTRDYTRASNFYSLVGEYTSVEVKFGSTRYKLLMTDGLPRALIRNVPANRKTRWTPFVVVDDVKATVASAKSLGAKVITKPRSIQWIGNVAVLETPFGGVIGVVEPSDLDEVAPRGSRTP